MRACFWIFTGLIALPTAAEATTWSVCASGCDYLDVSSAVANVSTTDGDTIEVDAGLYPFDVDVGKSVEVVGVDGRDSTFLFGGGSIHTAIFNGANVTIRGVTIGGPGTQKCILVSQNSTLNLDDVQVQYCTTESQGAGLKVDAGSTANLTNTDFFSNDSGALAGGHIYSAGTLTITDGSFALGKSDLSGAIHLAADSVSVLTRVSFTGNTSGDIGGAVRVENGSLDCEDCEFFANLATAGGGAVAVEATGTFPVNFSGGTFAGNSSVDGGGILYDAPTALTIDDVFFVANSASNEGGAIAFSPSGDSGTLTVTDSAFHANSTVVDGGALRVLGGGMTTLIGNKFSENSAGEDGGAARAEQTDLEIIDNDFCMNDSGWAGGALYLRQPDGVQPALIMNNRFIENYSIGAFGFGGAVYLRLSPQYAVSNNDFYSHDSSQGGGTIRTQDVDFTWLRNNVIAFTAGNGGIDGVNVSAGSDFDYNLWFDNQPDNATGEFSGADIGANALFVDPSYSDVSADGDCTNDDFRPTAGGPLIDAGDPLPVYYDPDGSRNDIGSYGGPRAPIYDLDGDGYDTLEDCDDDNPLANPGMVEIVGNEIDDDCDGLEECYTDADGDGFGSANRVVSVGDLRCNGLGEATFAGDCDDGDPANFPFNTEICDGGDNDCDGSVDTGSVDWNRDSDGDGFGDPTAVLSVAVCSPDPGGFVLDNRDCDDSGIGGVNINILAIETCNGVDDDCDGTVDDGAVCPCDTVNEGASTYLFCTNPLDQASASADCASMGYHLASVTDVWEHNRLWENQSTYAGNSGFWNGYNDIASEGNFVWEAADPGTGFAFWDLAAGEPNSSGNCVYMSPANGFWRDTNCALTHEYICEIECTSAIWYADLDSDGFGDPLAALESCTRPASFVADSSDCDDNDPTINPGGVEAPADGMDGDCDGFEDCYVDDDGDGHGNDLGLVIRDLSLTCTGGGISPVGDDCDDTNPNVSPTAFDLPADGIDDDCDGFDSCYFDGDGDGYGDDGGDTIGSMDADCSDANESESDDDCDDNDPARNPGATEIPGDIIDQDCDGDELCFTDDDGDDYGTAVTVLTSDLTCSNAGLASVDGDCDDTDIGVNPGAIELVADEIDSDCDGSELCFFDGDGDGFGASDGSTVSSGDASCADPGESTDSLDCDDGDPAVNPDAEELTGDGIDGDCDGGELCYADADLDGFGADDGTTVGSDDIDCDDLGEAAADEDCDDGDDSVFPGAEEDNSPTDRDCDGFTDTKGEVGLAGCSCDSGSGPSGWFGLGILSLMVRRRLQ